MKYPISPESTVTLHLSLTLEDGTVTIRDRDTLEQTRVSKEECVGVIREKLGM